LYEIKNANGLIRMANTVKKNVFLNGN